MSKSPLQTGNDLCIDAVILDLMVSDKKSLNQKPRFVIIEAIGKVKSQDEKFSFEADNETIEKAIKLCKND